MKNLTLGLLSFCLLLSATSVLSAQQSKLLKARYYMESLQYDKAISTYEKCYQRDPSSTEVLDALANAYKKLNRIDEALAFFEQSAKQTDLPPNFYYYYGQLLFEKGDCSSAQERFNTFLDRKPYDERRTLLEDVCSYYEQLTQEQEIGLDHPSFNDSQSDLAPAFYHDELVFGSVRSNSKEVSAYDLYKVKPRHDAQQNKALEFGKIQSFSKELNTELNEAIVSFSKDFKTVYFTTNQEQIVDEKYPLRRLEIKAAYLRKNGQWSSPQALSINSPNYSTAHPSISPDGNRLFFVSDMPGGFGGKDIYVSEKTATGWGVAVNLGPSVNTEGDELFPYFHHSGTLYFASNGHLGLGGQDIFKVSELEKDAWTKAENLAQPINSTADDFGLILNEEASYGFFSSNRTGSKGADDIYAFRPKRTLLNLALVDDDNTVIEEQIELMDVEAGLNLQTNEAGEIALWLEDGQCKQLKVIDQSYYPIEIRICDQHIQSSTTYQWKIKARTDQPQQEETETTVEAEAVVAAQAPIEYEGDYLLYGRLFDKLTAQDLAYSKVVIQEMDSGAKIELTTDDKGKFVYHWDQASCIQIFASKDGYFSKSLDQELCKNNKNGVQNTRIFLSPYQLNDYQIQSDQYANTKGIGDFEIGNFVYGDDEIYIPYKLNVYYDSGRASVRAEGIAEINNLYRLMTENPELVVEISSHTDATGGAAANWKLSQRRANAIVRFLIQKGIPSDRLIARGYGEERPVVKCDEEQDECNEEAHQLNRRTEFRVLDQRYGQSN